MIVAKSVGEMSGFRLGRSFKKYAIGATMVAGGAYALSRSPAVRTVSSNMTKGIATKSSSFYNKLVGSFPWAKKAKTSIHDTFHKTVKAKAKEAAGIKVTPLITPTAPLTEAAILPPKKMGLVKPLLVGGGVLATVLALKG